MMHTASSLLILGLLVAAFHLILNYSQSHTMLVIVSRFLLLLHMFLCGAKIILHIFSTLLLLF